MTNRRYAETPFYDFDRNYADAVDLTRKVFGDERADALAAAKGKSTRSDFMTAITWGWFFQRPILSMPERALILIGNLANKGMAKPLRDYVQWGLAVGLHREKIREAIFTLSVYGGVPTTEWALGVVDDLCAELDAAGWQPFTPPGPLFEGVEHNYYDFVDNYLDGLDVGERRTGRGAGETREERLARTGQSAIGDFQAIHWGWMMHRPLISPRERYFFLMGADSANKGYLALKDHTSWALVEGVTRAEIDEALIMLALYNGWPANRQSQVAVGEYFAERDATASSHPTPSP